MPIPTPMAIPDTPALRAEVIRFARQMAETGLTHNTSGNLGHRVEGGLIVTPTGMPYDQLEPEDIVRLDHLGQPTGRRLPTSEWQLHLEILAARPEVNAVVHSHSPFASTISCLRQGIPAFHYMIATVGGHDIRCAPYATFGTEALAQHAVAALNARKGCLLANHGQIALGPDLASAMRMAIEIESLAGMYWRALQIGDPVILDDAEMAVVQERFRTYGVQPALEPP